MKKQSRTTYPATLKRGFKAECVGLSERLAKRWPEMRLGFFASHHAKRKASKGVQ